MLALPLVKVCAGNLCSLVRLTKVMGRPQGNRMHLHQTQHHEGVDWEEAIFKLSPNSTVAFYQANWKLAILRFDRHHEKWLLGDRLSGTQARKPH